MSINHNTLLVAENAKIIVAFHIGRGGRFHNPGHRTFIGEHNLQHLIARNNQHLYEMTVDEDGEECAPYLVDNSGTCILDNEDMQKETGCLNFDNDYDTDYCKYIEDCTEEELEIIREDNGYKSYELEEYLKDEMKPIGITF